MNFQEIITIDVMIAYSKNKRLDVLKSQEKPRFTRRT